MAQNAVETKPKSTGGYHTVFRCVKQVTIKIDGQFVKFSTGLSRLDIDANSPPQVAHKLERQAKLKVPINGTHDQQV
jgi:hypothetical protein